MSDKPKILCLGDVRDKPPEATRFEPDSYEYVTVKEPLRALSLLSRNQYAGLLVEPAFFAEAAEFGRLLQNERILDGMPDGVVVVDSTNTIRWGNDQFRRWVGCDSVVDRNFYAVLGNPEILGPDFCPFHTALATGQPSSSKLRLGEHRFFQVHAAPVLGDDALPEHLIVSVRDVTEEMLQQQKLAAIHKAGIELADMTPEEVFHMGVEQRIELLKDNILHFTQDLLNFNVVEIRLLDEETGRLEPLLAVGIDDEAAQRPLFANSTGNGVTGFVAATGKSYLCEDTAEDPLYLQGFKGARSSLTVPLSLHEQTIGTFNVESPEPRAFSESDQQFLEIFSRDVAVALNTLELLVAQKANTAQESVDAIHSAVALPVDEILNDAVNVMEQFIGHESSVAERLRRILKNARDIKQVIQKIGQKMTPVEAVPAWMQQTEQRPKLRGRRILVVDADDMVRNDAHALLERYGCIVETAHDGGEATYMVRSMHDGNYDAIIVDIRLPDMRGYDLMMKLKEFMGVVPIILMTGFGYDPGHSIVKARQAGLLPNAVLYKPFRLDQLLTTVETVIDATADEMARLAQSS
ncbi:MAG: response regulator [Pirellulaceae bacterium]